MPRTARVALAFALAALAALLVQTSAALAVPSPAERVFYIIDSSRDLLGELDDEEAEAPALPPPGVDPILWRTFHDAGHDVVPDWAEDVRATLEAEGVPFDKGVRELLSSPEINISDPSEPLFPKGSSPISLYQLAVFQAGENAFLRSLSADELLLEVWPDYNRYYNRPAGTPPPEDLQGVGMTLGGFVREACTENTVNGCVNGITYRYSPIRYTDAYKRWKAYAFPGLDGDGQNNGFAVDSHLGWAYTPLTGEFFQVSEGSNSVAANLRKAWLQKLQSGEVLPTHFITAWQDVVESFLVSRAAQAGFLGDPSIWFVGDYAPYAPDLLSEDVTDRYLTLLDGG